MAGAIDITFDDLCGNFDPATVTAVFCDDGTGRPGKRLDVAISVGRRLGDAILLKGWPTIEQIETLIAEDDAVRALMCRLIIATGMQGKAEWTGDGAPHKGLEQRTMAQLELLATAQARSVGEAAAGKNPNAGGTIQPGTPNFMFAPSRSRPRRGGY